MNIVPIKDLTECDILLQIRIMAKIQYVYHIWYQREMVGSNTIIMLINLKISLIIYLLHNLTLNSVELYSIIY